jgi:hypothetical protein
VGRITVHPVAQRTIRFPVNIYIKEGEVALTFSLHGELNAQVAAVQVVQEILWLLRSVWPDDGVVHVAKLAEGLVRGQVKCLLFEILHVEVGDDWRQWPMATPSICS